MGSAIGAYDLSTPRSATVPFGYPLHVEVGYGAAGIPVGVTRWPKMVSPYEIGHGSLQPERVGVGHGAVGIPVACRGRLWCRCDTRWRDYVARDVDVRATEAYGLEPLRYPLE